MFPRTRILILRNVYKRSYYTVKYQNTGNEQSTVAKQIYSKIKATGPVTVAWYMKEVLVNPNGGYYMHKNVIGNSGDFITSPELGQMFGEMVGICCLNEWSKVGSPKPFQIVELGPGRGSLSQDILRVFGHFESLKNASLGLVEVSPFLSDIQANTLCMQSKNILDNNSVFYKEGISKEGVPVKWYKQLSDVPEMFTIFVAHEFFDALPIHKFEMTERGYREILIDINQERDCGFRYVLARGETPASKMLISPSDRKKHLEISPESLVLVKSIAERLESYGGVSLIADYGHDGEGTDTFRAFKKHQLHDPLVDPGTADLTADVDFARIKQVAMEENKTITFGPINQRDFLMNMGIDHRFKILYEKMGKQGKEALQFSYNMMLDEDKMGKRFKFLSIMPSVLADLLKKVPVAGFNARK